tara:strand:- start:1357 stop:1833 length:477 start_codon:yes stop_codon:yes gene_type:complete
MTQEKGKTNKLTVRKATKWKERARTDRANRKQISRAQKFALELLDYLDENQISQVEFARKMEVSPQQANKILRAKSNLTFETIDKIETALGVVISSPKIKSRKHIFSQPIKRTMKLVHKSSQKPIEPIYEKSIEPSKNEVLHTTLENIESYAYTADQI